ncbi:hypothetical protein K1719_020435 [Acacia pycnantha]|nr:hypothetical protein K1719_020435 [Acacia pycnantha]
MCQEMNKTFFSDANDTKDTWSILAKVLQKWSIKRKVAPYAMWKVGMLLADEKGSRIEVSATHKNLIGKLKDEPREGMVYNFQNFQDQRRECDIIKRLNFSIADQSENTINVALWGDCAEEIFGKKHEDMEPPITVLESTTSIGNIRTISQENVIKDGDNTVSQLTTPPEAYTKWKTLGNDTPIVYEDLGLVEICTQKMSSTKPLKNIKKEK